MRRLQTLLDDPLFHVRFNLVGLLVWLLLLPASLTIWRESLIYVVLMSWYAIFAAHLTGLIAAKAEVKVDK